jgi:hypothetical protein
MLPALLLLLPLLQSPAPGSDAAALEIFAAELPEFMGAWDQRDVEGLREYVDPEIGFWVLFKVGVALVPRHFRNLEDFFNHGQRDLDVAGLAGFDGCTPSAGPMASCMDTGYRPASCQYGLSPPVFLDAFDRLLDPATGEANFRAELRRERDLLASAAGESVYYVSDGRWGAVFFFARLGNRWQLLVIDMDDCSA